MSLLPPTAPDTQRPPLMRRQPPTTTHHFDLNAHHPGHMLPPSATLMTAQCPSLSHHVTAAVTAVHHTLMVPAHDVPRQPSARTAERRQQTWTNGCTTHRPATGGGCCRSAACIAPYPLRKVPPVLYRWTCASAYPYIPANPFETRLTRW